MRPLHPLEEQMPVFRLTGLVRRFVRRARPGAFILCLALVLIGFATAMPASAQGVTGTVSGTVKDAQGGVIPGASVTLISESRQTRSTRL
jgi:hypothetical protein